MNAVRGSIGLVAFLAAGAAIAYLGLMPGRQVAKRLADERLALEARAGELTARIETWRAAGRRASLPPELARAAADAEQAALSIQRQVVDLAAQYQIALSAFGAVAPPAQLSTEAAAFELEGSAAYADAVQFLAVIDGAVPRLAIAHLAIVPVGGQQLHAANGQVSLRVQVWGFWEAGQG